MELGSTDTVAEGKLLGILVVSVPPMLPRERVIACSISPRQKSTVFGQAWPLYGSIMVAL